MTDLIYDALMLGRNKNIAGEEYLCAAGKKPGAFFAAKEDSLYFSDIENDMTGIIHLVMKEKGYAEIEIYCIDRFIETGSRVITTDEFEEDEANVIFCIKADRLHAGRNFARITFRTPQCSCSVDIVIQNGVISGRSYHTERAKLAQLCDTYLDLRIGSLFQTEWQERSLEIIGDINGSSPIDLCLLLYKANILIADEKYQEADYLIEFAAAQIPKLPNKNWDLTSYFYYISSLYEMDDAVTEDVLEHVRKIYKNHPSWRILWILFYMDRELASSPERIFELAEQEFAYRGCCSPVMYFEAYDALRSKPDIMNRLSGFIIRVLEFASKKDCLDTDLAIGFAELIWQETDSLPAERELYACIRILRSSYERSDSKLILKALCKLLIHGDIRDKKYHIYYLRAIEAFIETEKIYNYFIYSSDKSTPVRLPKAVAEYLSGREGVLGDDEVYYLACLIKQKNEYRNYYERALARMRSIATANADAGMTDRYFEVIYRELMDNGMLPPEAWQRMPEILHTVEISTDNEMLVSALAFHKEFNDYQESELEDGHALLRIFSNDALILFKDHAGNLYHNISYSSRAFTDKDRYMRLCIQYSPVSRYMLIDDGARMLLSSDRLTEVISFLKNNIGKGEFRSSYEQQLLADLTVQLAKRRDCEGLHKEIYSFCDMDLRSDICAKIIELMIDDGSMELAFEKIKEKGFRYISDEHIERLTKNVIENACSQDERQAVSESDADENDDMLCDLACHTFMHSPFDEKIFYYLTEHYDKDIDVLLKMYGDAKEKNIFCISLNKKIIKDIIDQNICPLRSEEIFEEYYECGTDEELKHAFMTYAAAKYLFDNDNFGHIFETIEKEINKGTLFDAHVQVAYLLYKRNAKDMDSRTLKRLEDMLKKLVRCGIIIEEFKDYGKFFRLPTALENAHIAQLISDEYEGDMQGRVTSKNIYGAAPQIEYEILHDGSIIASSKEAMHRVARGCYTRIFTLFPGEKLIYRINGGEKNEREYTQKECGRDGSRYCDIDNIIKLAQKERFDLPEAAARYYIKNKLVDSIFSTREDQ